MSLRIGEGIDRHRLVEGRALILGGVGIEHSHGLAGHSDGDALTHAICDALLGALALGDLGQHFSDTDPANADRDSLEFLEQVVRRVEEAGWRVANVDATIMAEAPRLAPHVAAMRAALAGAMGVGVGQVSVKATRGEGVGPEGEGRAITVRAVALVESV
jgi:2-C-methyl-D-erythritol 2,4-cyclodiphosphate synthase